MYSERIYPNVYIPLQAEIDSIIDGEIQEAELMGVDLQNPELMGAWLKRLVGKIKEKIQKKKGGYAISTPYGTATVEKGRGFSFEKPADEGEGTGTGLIPGGMDTKKLLIFGGAAAVILLLLMKR